jgi:hypothetical protein
MDDLTRILWTEKKYPVRQQIAGMPHRKLGHNKESRLLDLLPTPVCQRELNNETISSRRHGSQHGLGHGPVRMGAKQRFECATQITRDDCQGRQRSPDLDWPVQCVSQSVDSLDQHGQPAPDHVATEEVDGLANDRDSAGRGVAAVCGTDQRLVTHGSRTMSQGVQNCTLPTGQADAAVAVDQFSGVKVEDGAHPTISPTAHSGCAASHSAGVQMPTQITGGRSLDAPATLDDPDGGSLVRNGESL